MPYFEIRLVKYYGEDAQERKIETQLVSRPYAHGETDEEFINSVTPRGWTKKGDECFKELWAKNLNTEKVWRFQTWGTDKWSGTWDEEMNEEWDKQLP